MGRIRTIKPAFFKHEGLYDAERESGLPLRIAFAGLWTVADREGRFHWRPRTLKTDVLPHDACDFGDVLAALEKFGFVERYRSGGKTFGHIPSFSGHQHVNKYEPASTIPVPSSHSKKHSDAVALPGERKGKERNLNRESKSEDPFERFWSRCPKKLARVKTRDAFDKAAQSVSQETLIEAMTRYAQSRIGQDEKFTLYPATWLIQERWHDDLPAAVAAPSPHASWDIHGERLIAEVGQGVFAGYFAAHMFDAGPPARLTVASGFLRDLIERKYGRALSRAFGPVSIEVAS